MENKVDILSFETLVRVVDTKVDRMEFNALKSPVKSYRSTTTPQMINEISKDDLHTALEECSSLKVEVEKRLNDIEK